MDARVIDTSPEADAVQRAVWTGRDLGRRLELVLQLSDEVRDLAVTGVLARCPTLSARQARLTVVRQALGNALFEAAYRGRLDGAG